jgi:hypothetical protein
MGDVHSRNIRDDRDKERDHSAPIGSEGIIPIPATSTIQRRDVDMSTLNHPIVCSDDRSNRGKENSQARHKAQQTRSRVDDFPRDHDPACRNRSDDHTAADIDVFRTQTSHVVRARDNVRGEIGSDLGDNPAETDEEGPTTPGGAVPLCGERERVPDVLAVDYLRGTGGDDAKEAEHKLNQGEEGNLPVYALFFFKIAGEIWDVCCHGCPVLCIRYMNIGKTSGFSNILPAAGNTGQT